VTFVWGGIVLKTPRNAELENQEEELDRTNQGLSAAISENK